MPRCKPIRLLRYRLYRQRGFQLMRHSTCHFCNFFQPVTLLERNHANAQSTFHVTLLSINVSVPPLEVMVVVAVGLVVSQAAKNKHAINSNFMMIFIRFSLPIFAQHESLGIHADWNFSSKTRSIVPFSRCCLPLNVRGFSRREQTQKCEKCFQCVRVSVSVIYQHLHRGLLAAHAFKLSC